MSQPNAVVLGVANGLLPDNNEPKIARVAVEITAAGVGVVDLFKQLSQEQIDNVQTIIVNNKDGANPLTITTSVLMLPYTIPAGAQAILPFFMTRGDGRITFERADAGTIPVFFHNVPAPAIVWDADAAGNVVTVSGTVTVNQTRPAAATRASVAAAVADTLLLAANANRQGATFYNDSAAILYLALGGAATVADYTVQVPPQGYFSLASPAYTGAVRGIWSAAVGAVKVTELA